jgi:Asp-tRNA(Asn)/Glu-tRNA(Gln) amidotransferase B subunit
VLEEKKAIVEKVLRTGKTGPVMSRVGSVMQSLNNQGDPKLIQQMIKASIEEMNH